MLDINNKNVVVADFSSVMNSIIGAEIRGQNLRTLLLICLFCFVLRGKK